MSLSHDLAYDVIASVGASPRGPDFRQIELYSKKKQLSFEEQDPTPPLPMQKIAGALRAFFALEAHLGLGEALSWASYLALPRSNAVEKLTAELYRMLRILRRVAFHPHGHIEQEDGIIRINGAVDRVALSLEITLPGLTLLEAAVAYLIDAPRQPYPTAYVEAMLSQYFTDIITETKRFADEDRILYQFLQKYYFNRHFRYDCDNPKTALQGDQIVFDIPPLHRQPDRTPIDFYLVHDGVLHIIPVEALVQSALPLKELPRWRARTLDGLSLPARFRSRFSREEMVVGLPMT